MCDGKWDCPDGDDEYHNPVCSSGMNCMNMFKCSHSDSSCIHLGNVCDGIHDCPNGGDEIWCEIKTFSCCLKCTCLAFAIACSYFNDKETQSFERSLIVSVSIQESIFPLENYFFTLFPKGEFFSLKENGFLQLCHIIIFLVTTIGLDLRKNEVKTITKQCFKSLLVLKYLLLDLNLITSLNYQSFFNLTNLVFLSLDKKPITKLSSQILAATDGIKLLSFQGIQSVSHIDKEALNVLNPIVIHTSDWRLCCNVPQIISCTAIFLWYQSCSELLPDKKTNFSAS